MSYDKTWRKKARVAFTKIRVTADSDVRENWEIFTY